MPLGVRSLRSFGPTNKARFCLTRVVSLDGSGVTADIRMLDDDGAVLLAVDGLSMGTALGAGSAEADRVLNERLLGVEWRMQELPALAPHLNAGSWLVVNTSDFTDLVASELTDALKLNDADVSTMSWPQHADHAANGERLTTYLSQGGCENIVEVAAPRNDVPMGELADRGAEHVRHLVRIVHDLAEAGAGSARLYVITRGAQTVLPGELTNLEQAGIRGLLRVVGAEHSHLRPTQVDVDENTEDPWWPTSCCWAPRRTRPHSATVGGTPLTCTRARCGRKSVTSLSLTTSATGCGWRFGPQATCRPSR